MFVFGILSCGLFLLFAFTQEEIRIKLDLTESDLKKMEKLSNYNNKEKSTKLQNMIFCRKSKRQIGDISSTERLK